MSIATEIEDDPDVIDGVYYPSEDGKPMSLTVVHVATATELFNLLKKRYKSRPDVFIGYDNFWYWEKGNPKARISPDIMVCFGVDRDRIRRSYIAWRHNDVVPSVCFEFASRGTWRKNLNETKQIYERLGVSEYFLYDPDCKYIKAGLLGWRLKRGKYVKIAADENGWMLCKSLNSQLVPDGDLLRLFDPVTGQFLLTGDQEAELQERRADEERRKAEEERRKAEEERRKAEEERRKAEEERRKAEEERRKAEEERCRAEELQNEVERLRAQLQTKKHRANGGRSGSS
jgi:Uma2 family endonuclease